MKINDTEQTKNEVERVRIEIIEEYVKEATGADWIKQDKLDEYRKRVLAIAKSFYYIYLVNYAIEIMKVLAAHKDNKKEAIKTSKELFDKQEHSYNTAVITAITVQYFSPYFANEFYKAVM